MGAARRLRGFACRVEIVAPANAFAAKGPAAREPPGGTCRL